MDVETNYAVSGDVHIAYQVVGSGQLDLLFVSSFLSNIELRPPCGHPPWGPPSQRCL
jgi:hypothetical protein